MLYKKRSSILKRLWSLHEQQIGEMLSQHVFSSPTTFERILVLDCLLSPAIGNKTESGAFLCITQCPVCCNNKCFWRQRLWPHTLCTDDKFRNPVYFLFRELGGYSSHRTTRWPRRVNALLYTCSVTALPTCFCLQNTNWAAFMTCGSQIYLELTSHSFLGCNSKGFVDWEIGFSWQTCLFLLCVGTT